MNNVFLSIIALGSNVTEKFSLYMFERAMFLLTMKNAGEREACKRKMLTFVSQPSRTDVNKNS